MFLASSRGAPPLARNKVLFLHLSAAKHHKTARTMASFPRSTVNRTGEEVRHSIEQDAIHVADKCKNLTRNHLTHAPRHNEANFDRNALQNIYIYTVCATNVPCQPSAYAKRKKAHTTHILTGIGQKSRSATMIMSERERRIPCPMLQYAKCDSPPQICFLISPKKRTITKNKQFPAITQEISSGRASILYSPD